MPVRGKRPNATRGHHIRSCRPPSMKKPLSLCVRLGVLGTSIGGNVGVIGSSLPDRVRFCVTTVTTCHPASSSADVVHGPGFDFIFVHQNVDTWLKLLGSLSLHQLMALRLTLFGRSLLLMSTLLLANAICWILAGIL